MKIRCYDNLGRSFDRYTVVFTEAENGWYTYLGMSENPYHPQGFGQHGQSKYPIDKPSYKHLGRRIAFSKLPENCKKLVISDLEQLTK